MDKSLGLDSDQARKFEGEKLSIDEVRGRSQEKEKVGGHCPKAGRTGVSCIQW